MEWNALLSRKAMGDKKMGNMGKLNFMFAGFGSASSEERLERLQKDRKITELLRRIGFKRAGKNIKNGEKYTQFAEMLSACRDAYRQYLEESGRYARTKRVKTSYLAPGKIEYRIARLREYVEEDLSEEDAVKAVMAEGWFGCVKPILDEVRSLEEELAQAGDPSLPEEQELEEQLLRRFFPSSPIMELLQLPGDIEKCCGRYSPPLDRMQANQLEQEYKALRQRYKNLLNICNNPLDPAVYAALDSVQKELAKGAEEMRAETEHYEKLLESLRALVEQLSELTLSEKKREDGSYDEECLPALREAYRKADVLTEEVTEIGCFRSDQ